MSHDNGNKNTPKPRHRWNPFVQLRSASPVSGRRPIQRAADMADLREALPDWYLTPDQERTARSRMVRLCEHLDSLLETGIRRRQISSTCCRFVAMGVWAIEVDVAWRRVSAGPIGEDGAFSPTPRPFEVGIPLEEPDWIPSLLTRLGVGFVGQRDIFMGKALEEEWNRWLCHTLHDFLRHEPRFQRLRHDALSLGTAIPRDILGMAMAAKIRHDPVVIAGFGRVGQIVGRVLRIRKIGFTALDAAPTHVDFLRKFGNRIYYGDATRLDLLRAAHLDKAKLLVVAIDDMVASIKVVELVQHHFPQVKIYARARNRQHAYQLLALGVNMLIRETFEASLTLSQQVLEGLGIDPKSARESISKFAAYDETMMRTTYMHRHDEKKLVESAKQYAAELESLFNTDAENEPAPPAAQSDSAA